MLKNAFMLGSPNTHINRGLFHPHTPNFSSDPFSLDEAVEQVQGDQHPVSGVCGRSNRKDRVSKRSSGGQRRPQR